MNTKSYVKKAIFSSIFGALVLVGTATLTNAQSSRDYREWQKAQIEANQRQAEWQRSQSNSDWKKWQKAQAKANQYSQMYGYSNNGYYTNNGNHYGWNNPRNPHYNGGNTVYNNGYYNNGYYNNGYYNTGITESQARQAVSNGYSQGYRQGQSDRRYGRTNSYNYYGNGNDQYQYYYQQGFQRGYEDGYYSRSTYGYRSGNNYNILSSVLGTILNLATNR